MSETPRPELPDHLSVDPRSPHHVAAVFEHDIGIRFNGKDRLDVEEYCISEGWVKVPAGKTLDRKGKPLLIDKLRPELGGEVVKLVSDDMERAVKEREERKAKKKKAKR